MNTTPQATGELLLNIITSGFYSTLDSEVTRKIILLNIVCITGLIALFPLGLIAWVQGNPMLAIADLMMGLILMLNLVYLRKSGDVDTVCYIGMVFVTILFVYLLFSGGVNNSAFVWYYTYPLFALFLLGSKKGMLATIILFSPAIAFFIIQPDSSAFADYSLDLKLRFIPSFIVVAAYSFLFEFMREKSQKQLRQRNQELNATVVELKQTKHALQSAQKHLERKVRERTSDLRKINAQLNAEIHERKLIEHALRESETLYRSMMEAMKDPVYICSPEYRLSYVNPAMKAKIGHDATGEPCFQVLFQQKEKCPWCVFEEVKLGRHMDYEVLAPPMSNAYAISNSPIRHIDGSVSQLAILRDVTQFKAIEDQLRHAQKMESIGTMASGIAHDFNNILGVILGNIDLARLDEANHQPISYYLGEIKQASHRAKDIVSQLLSFSRKSDHKLQPVSIIPLVKEAIGFLKSTIPATIEIKENYQTDEGVIAADPVQINQVLINLCTNAYHAMEKTGGLLMIGVREVVLEESLTQVFPRLYKGKYVKMTISDTGSGIPPEIVDRIFDPYFTTKEPEKGTGMGLAVVHGIIQSHKGSISVSSELGKGTTFTIHFPLSADAPQKKAPKIETYSGGSETILFVDDETPILNIGQKILERLGYTVITAGTPAAALEHFGTDPQKFDLVITDMTMPHMTGVELFKKMKAVRKDIPIILSTGYSDFIDEEIAQNLGVSAYVMKPLAMSQLASTIREVIGRRDIS